jgi:mRNA-degrading endonuclease RelE of RelBE toxin-antitoxin system
MNYRFHNELINLFEKLSKRDNKLYLQILKKIDEIMNSESIDHYKNLNYPLQQFKRVHISEKYVLIFQYLKAENIILFRYFDHRDNIYNKKYD